MACGADSFHILDTEITGPMTTTVIAQKESAYRVHVNCLENERDFKRGQSFAGYGP